MKGLINIMADSMKLSLDCHVFMHLALSSASFIPGLVGPGNGAIDVWRNYDKRFYPLPT